MAAVFYILHSLILHFLDSSSDNNIADWYIIIQETILTFATIFHCIIIHNG